ncbi:MAG TPA: hydantoin racemase [Candidatus Atribacteria bacterium]|nr:hydantoin racemase [Candidatus Atribacteria bacterium]
MKKILVINPITTDSFNNMVKSYLEELKSPDIEIEVVNIKAGPSSIETFYDEAFALPEILKTIEKYKAECNAIVINCFADPAVNAARELTDIPVVGPAEASMMIALMLGHRFGVISTFRNSGPWVELQARNMGIEEKLAGAIGVDIPVLELEKDFKKTVRYLINAARNLIDSKGAEVIVLGCTGMAPVARIIKKELGVPVVEPMTAAFKMAELMVSLKLNHSKIGLYMTPNRDKIK